MEFFVSIPLLLHIIVVFIFVIVLLFLAGHVWIVFLFGALLAATNEEVVFFQFLENEKILVKSSCTLSSNSIEPFAGNDDCEPKGIRPNMKCRSPLQQRYP